MITLLIFVIILSILVLAHEFGHFIVAKYFGIKVEEFAIGFPPTLWSRKKGDTNYMINSIPFGGYVKLYGEDGAHAKEKNSFAHKKWWQRGAVITAGITMNLILGAICLAIAFMFGMPVMDANPETAYPYANIENQVIVYEISPESSVQGVVEEGDEILSINGVDVESVEQFQTEVQKNGGNQAQITLNRKNEIITVIVNSVYSEEDNAYQLGTYIVEGQIVKYPFYLAIPMGFVEMVRLLGAMLVAFYMIIKDLIVAHQAPTQIAGPVGIYQIAATASELGLVYLIQLMAILNINLAIINFLPIPALDGGRLLFIIIEKIRGRKISTHIENLIHTAGFLVIIGLIILVTISDIKNFF